MKPSIATFMAALLVVLAGCGSAANQEGELIIHIEAPQRFKPGSARFKRLLARTTFLETEIKGKDGKPARYRFAPSEWDRLSLRGASLSVPPEMITQITVKVWDKRIDGVPRNHPALEGSVKLAEGKVSSAELCEVHIKVRSKVSASEYD